MSRQNRLACLYFLLLAPGFLTTIYTRAYNSLHLEVLALLGWGVLMVLGGLSSINSNRGQIDRSAVVYAGLLFALPAVVLLVQQAFGHAVPYFGMVAVAVFYLLVSACVFLLGSFASAKIQSSSAAPNAGVEALNAALRAVVGVAVCSALIGIAQYLQLPISETFVSSVSQIGASYGNLRQPNLFALLGVLGLISLIALRTSNLSFHWIHSGLASLVYLLLLLSVVLSTSRTGAVLVGLVFLWGLVETWRAGKPQWMALLAFPIYLLMRYVAVQMDVEGWLPFFGAHRQGLVSTAIEGDFWRRTIWAKSLALIQAHPLTGVGYGNIAFAMFTETLPVPMASVTEHAHNIFLHIAVELGLPVAMVLTLTLVALMYRSRGVVKTNEGRAIAVFLLAVLTHSLLEYPLWYAYFLLPFAFTLGFFAQMGTVGQRDALQLLRDHQQAGNAVPTPGEDLSRFGMSSKILLPAGVFTTLLAFFGLWDYAKVSPSYELNSNVPLHDRVIQSYKSVLFLNLADYSALNMSGISGYSRSPIASSKSSGALSF
jgi:O-antigen ligase